MDGLGLIALGLMVLISTPIVACDLRERRIPLVWTLVLGGAGLAYNLAREPDWTTAALSAVQILVVFCVLAGTRYALARLGRPSVVGGGDIKFLLAACAWVGLEGAAATLILAGLSLAAVTALARVPAGVSRWSQPRPFAPMLAAALATVSAAVELIR